MSLSTKRIYGNMEWFDVAEEPPSINDLPEAFARAKSLWEEDSAKNFDVIVSLLKDFLGARFLPSNISNWEEIFDDIENNGIPEIESSKINIVGIEYSGSKFPTVRAEAFWDVPVKDSINSIDTDAWQDDNGYLTDGVVFYWNVPRTEETQELDFTSGSNLGVECAFVDGDPS